MIASARINRQVVKTIADIDSWVLIAGVGGGLLTLKLIVIVLFNVIQIVVG